MVKISTIYDQLDRMEDRLENLKNRVYVYAVRWYDIKHPGRKEDYANKLARATDDLRLQFQKIEKFKAKHGL